ncbi:hypothetical protein [Winogradskyella tangerina]|uniref:hypothetical protein n=1 Tax=Winogradskyella tangerina TaxID=2023240 RepID=UPI000DBE9B38|nr:hypothetical protein [Winogradskyella tangerina]
MNGLKHIVKTVKGESPILFVIVLILFSGAILCVPAMLWDDRELMGINVWIKPLKFFISTAVYTLTVGYLVTLYPFSNLKKHIIRNLVAWTLLFELVIITIQAARGVQSHFNTSSALNGSLFSAMGILIAINVLIMVWLAIETLRVKLKTPRAIQWAIFLAWIISIFSSWVGGQMIAQMAHNVGVTDGGVGLPLLNWSTVAGDLRVAHFFGLHSLQILPLFALVIHRKLKTNTKNEIAMVLIFSFSFAAFVFYTYYQASRALPFIS